MWLARQMMQAPRSEDNHLAPSSSGHSDTFNDAASSSSQLPLGGPGYLSRAKYGLLDDTDIYGPPIGHPNYYEDADDALHEPGEIAPRKGRSRLITETSDFRGSAGMSWRGLLNLGGLALLAGALLMLFGGALGQKMTRDRGRPPVDC